MTNDRSNSQRVQPWQETDGVRNSRTAKTATLSGVEVGEGAAEWARIFPKGFVHVCVCVCVCPWSNQGPKSASHAKDAQPVLHHIIHQDSTNSPRKTPFYCDFLPIPTTVHTLSLHKPSTSRKVHKTWPSLGNTGTSNSAKSRTWEMRMHQHLTSLLVDQSTSPANCNVPDFAPSDSSFTLPQ